MDSTLISALHSEDASTRLRAALAIGSDPEPDVARVLLQRCAVEPDFYVRDMLTWAMTRLPPSITVPLLIAELRSELPQARSQALHTLSKIKDPSTWPEITQALLRDPHDDVARSAWRAAVVLVPVTERSALAETLATQLGRGNRETQRSLSRAFVALGADAASAVLQRAMASPDSRIQVHARATERLLVDPSASF